MTATGAAAPKQQLREVCAGLGYPDRIFVNAKIITVDPHFAFAQAVAIRDGKFLAVGSDLDIESLAGPKTERIDLNGRAVLPGLIDTHAHVEKAGLLSLTVKLDDVSNIKEALVRISAMAERTPHGTWIRGGMWHPVSQLAEKRFLTRAEMDRAAPDHPVFLPIGHFALVNSHALALANITKDTLDPEGGAIHRDKLTGEPDGTLAESAELLVSSVIPEPSHEERIVQLKAAMLYFNSFGLTGAISAAVEPADMRAHQALRRRGEATLRVSAMFAPNGSLNPTMSLSEWETFFSKIGATSDFGDEWLSFSGVKLQVDGGMTLRTAFMRDGYPDEPAYHGIEVMDKERFYELVAIANRYGWRVGVHAVGDAAIDRVPDAFARADQERSIRSRRFVIIHASLIRPDQMDRAKALDVRVDAQSTFLWDKAAIVARYLGKETADRAFPLRTLIDKMGLDNLAQGTDYPINKLNPFINMYVMIVRKDMNGTSYGRDQAVSRQEAVRLYTSAAARYSFSENLTGSIEPGKLADMIVLSNDPLTASEEELKNIVVMHTIVQGKTVFERAA